MARRVAWSKTSSITFLSSESLRRYLLSRSDFKSFSRRLELSSSLNDWTLQVEKKKASSVSLGKNCRWEEPSEEMPSIIMEDYIYGSRYRMRKQTQFDRGNQI